MAKSQVYCCGLCGGDLARIGLIISSQKDVTDQVNVKLVNSMIRGSITTAAIAQRTL
jgi:hypothetical protein